MRYVCVTLFMIMIANTIYKGNFIKQWINTSQKEYIASYKLVFRKMTSKVTQLL